MVWRAVVRWVGGIYDLGRYRVAILDDGVLVARDQVVVWQSLKRTMPAKSRAERIADEDRMTRWSK